MSGVRDEASRLISIVSDSADVSDDAAKLLQSVPSHRRITILWKGINAYVPIFNSKPTMRDRFALVSRKQSAPQQRQVRLGAPALISEAPSRSIRIRRTHIKLSNLCAA